MIGKNIKRRLEIKMLEYDKGEFELFWSELGWEDWMNSYVFEYEQEYGIIIDDGMDMPEKVFERIRKDVKDVWDDIWEGK